MVHVSRNLFRRHVLQPAARFANACRPVGATGSEDARTPQNQLDCRLLNKVPPEVRVMIYELVLCLPVPVVHIVKRKDGSLGHVRCSSYGGECYDTRCYNEYSELSRSSKDRSPLPNGRAGKPLYGLLSLPLTCKKMLVKSTDSHK